MEAPEMTGDGQSSFSLYRHEPTDFETVREALREFARLARMFRYGGLNRDYELAKRALEAFGRIERPKLFE